MIRCPRCNTKRTYLHGYASGRYPASYSCGNGHHFTEDDVDEETARQMRAAGEASREESRRNAREFKA